MIFRNLDSDGDWVFGHGKADYVSGNEAIGLNIATRIRSWVGDCFFDTLAGIDWVNRLGSKNQRALLDADTRRVILTSYGVAGITSFNSVLNVRDYSASFSIDTVFGTNYQSLVSQGVNQNV